MKMTGKTFARSLSNDPVLLKTIIAEIYDDMTEYKRRWEHVATFAREMRRDKFGPSSERIQDGQLVFPFVKVIDLTREQIGRPEPATRPRSASKNGGKHGRRIIPLDAEVDEHTLDVPVSKRKCPKCKLAMKRIGIDTTRYFKHVPAVFKTVVIHRPKYACSCGARVAMAKLPPRPIDRCIADASIFAKTVVDKFCDHLPLYRQSQILKRHGINISVSTMSGWLMKLADLVKPLQEVMIWDVLQSEVIQTDDTPVPVMVDHVKHKTKTGRLWIYSGDKFHPNTVFVSSETREKKHAADFLHGYKGAIQGDGYKGYAPVCEKEGIKLAGCWSHARRKFFVAKDYEPALGYTAMAYISGIYEVERKIRQKSASLKRKGKSELTHAQIAETRQKFSMPILNKFYDWIAKKKKRVVPQSPMGKAIGYAISQRKTLHEYIHDGRLSIDNNDVERQLRMVAIGRKNFMFFGSKEGGERAAVFYSLIASCKRNGIEPYMYLCDIFQRIKTHPPENIHELMPANWKKIFLPLLKRKKKTPDTS